MATGFEAAPGFAAARRKRRQRLAWAAVRGLAGLTLFVLSLGAAYHVGVTQSLTEIGRLVKDLDAERERSRSITASLAAVEHQAEQGAAMRQEPAPRSVRSYSPELDRIIEIAGAKLGEGVSSERLGRAMTLLSRDRHCEPEVETKRVLVRTPVSREPGTLSFAGGKLVAGFKGAAARNATGRVEAWYDPAQPIEIGLAPTGQPSRPAIGTVPFEHGFVIDRREHILAVRSGDRRGQVEAQLRVCDYP